MHERIMGLLYDADLARIHAEGFSDLARTAAPELVKILRSSPRPVRHVYDVGCGAGITTAAMIEAGFEATAVELSPSLLALARVKAPAASFVQTSAYAIELQSCDAVLAIGEVLTYHAPEVDADERVRAFFRAVSRALAPGGRLIFDVIDADGPSLDARGWRREDTWSILWETREDRGASRLVRDIETFSLAADGLYRRARETHHVRLFREAQLRAWLADAGFEVDTARSYGAVPLAPRRVAYVATRVEHLDRTPLRAMT